MYSSVSGFFDYVCAFHSCFWIWFQVVRSYLCKVFHYVNMQHITYPFYYILDICIVIILRLLWMKLLSSSLYTCFGDMCRYFCWVMSWEWNSLVSISKQLFNVIIQFTLPFGIIKEFWLFHILSNTWSSLSSLF